MVLWLPLAEDGWLVEQLLPLLSEPCFGLVPFVWSFLVIDRLPRPSNFRPWWMSVSSIHFTTAPRCRRTATVTTPAGPAPTTARQGAGIRPRLRYRYSYLQRTAGGISSGTAKDHRTCGAIWSQYSAIPLVLAPAIFHATLSMGECFISVLSSNVFVPYGTAVGSCRVVVVIRVDAVVYVTSVEACPAR